jgi:hypothetical protein
MGKTIFGIFDDNQCVEEIRGTKVEKGIRISGKYLSVLESPVIISIGNNKRERIAELLTNSFDVKFGRLFIQPPLFRLVSIAEGVDFTWLNHRLIPSLGACIGKYGSQH